MDARDDNDVPRRPRGALETLGDALAAAFDEEVARWRGAARTYGDATLRSETLRALAAHDERFPRCDIKDKEAFASEDGGSDSGDDTSVGGTEAPSQSDSSTLASDATLADKWAALEGVLASLRPTAKQRRVLPLTGQSARRLRAEIVDLRKRSHARLWKYDAEGGDQDVGVASRDLCKKVLDTWAEKTRECAAERARQHAADQHRRRWRCISVMRAWRSICVLRRQARDRDRLLTGTIRSQSLHMSMRKWWTASRWSRGQRCLKKWGDAHRLEQGIRAWKELVHVVRKIKSLRTRVFQRRLTVTLLNWRRLAADGSVKRERARQVRAWKMRRYFSRLVQGTCLTRQQRRCIAIVRQHRSARIYQCVFDAWSRHNEASRKTSMAIEWRRHCLLSESFEAWNLLHRCFVYHRQIRASARAHYTRRVTTRLFRRWRIAVMQKRKQCDAIQKLVRINDMRNCFRHLQIAVRADQDRVRQLQQWKARRCLAKWRNRAHNRKRVSSHYQTVQRLHRDRLLRYVAWSPWREAYASNLHTKRLVRAADVHMLRKWWCRWKESESYRKARLTMHTLLDDAWKTKKQRLAIQTWRQFRDGRLTCAAKIEVVNSHRRLAILKNGFAHWRVWVQDTHRSRQLQAIAQELYCRQLFVRWRQRAKTERVREETRVIQILHRRPVWLKRSCLATWRRHTTDLIRARHTRLLRLWLEYASRAGQVREAQALRRLIRIRHLWVSWVRHTAARVRAKEASQLVYARTRHALLSHIFYDVWRFKVLHYSQARRKLELVSAQVMKLVCLNGWRQRSVSAKRARQAAEWYRHVLRRKYFHRLHQYCVVRPRVFRHTRALRTHRLLFHAWKAMYVLKRSQRRARDQLDHWRKQRAVRKLHSRATARRNCAQQTRDAVAFHRRCLTMDLFAQWQSFTMSRATCRAATHTILSNRRRQVLSRWRHAFARQSFVRDLEAQYDFALLRRSWADFVHAVHRKQDARDAWLAKLSTILQRKVLARWKRLVDMRRITLLKADWLYATAQNRLRHVAFDEWVHFTTIRAFVHLRQRRESDALKKTVLRRWKLFAITECRCNLRDQRVVSRSFAEWKKFALVREAAREIERRRQCASMVAAWKTWRVEFWIRQSHATSRTDILRRCLGAWRSCVTRRSLSEVITRRPTRRATAFDEALILQHVARHQRLMARRVIHAWALAAQTCKRQRRKSIPPRHMSSLAAFKEAPKKPVPDHYIPEDADHDSDSSSGDVWDQENADPNKRWQDRDTPVMRRSRGDNELAALEFWSSRVLETTFHAWRVAVDRS